jgi:hypothetical protein
MFVCAHFEKKAEKESDTPLAVPFAWFLLGALLLSFNTWLLTLTGIGLMLWSGRSLYFRARMAFCCMKAVRRAEERGETMEPCFRLSALV